MYVMKISHSYRYLCPCEAVDKIFLVVKVKSEVAARHFDVIFPQVVRLLQLAQVPDFRIQVFLRFHMAATA